MRATGGLLVTACIAVIHTCAEEVRVPVLTATVSDLFTGTGR